MDSAIGSEALAHVHKVAHKGLCMSNEFNNLLRGLASKHGVVHSYVFMAQLGQKNKVFKSNQSPLGDAVPNHNILVQICACKQRVVCTNKPKLKPHGLAGPWPSGAGDEARGDRLWGLSRVPRALGLQVPAEKI